MRKTLSFFCIILFMSPIILAQETADSKTLFEHVSGLKKKSDKLNLLLNLKSGFTSGFGENGLENPRFNFDHIRFEARGNITDRVAYRWRQRLNRANDESRMIDNAPNSIDFAYIAYKVSPIFSFRVGKQAAAFGGIEYDLNPIGVYGYSKIHQGNMNGFMTGISLFYQFTEGHELVFQTVNSMTQNFKTTYAGLDPAHESATLPFAYSINWNGAFFEKKYNTRWSASFISQTKKKDMFYISLGNQFDFSRELNMYFDIMYSNEGVDRRAIITNHQNRRVLDVDYLSFVSHFNYRLKPKLNIFVKGMFETASLTSAENPGLEAGKYLNSLGYQCGVEFFPMDDNLRFAASYIGQSDKFRDAEKYVLNNKIFVGFVYLLPIF